MADTKQGENGKVFISYSRKDKAFVQKLNDALDNAGVQAWVDWEGNRTGIRLDGGDHNRHSG